MESVSDGGHSPILVDFFFPGPVALDWYPPRPQLPPLLRLGSTELRQSPEWKILVDSWATSPAVALLASDTPHTVHSLSAALVGALQHLVILAGGWLCRPPSRRTAYDSDELRQARRILALLSRLHAQLSKPAASSLPGSWRRSWLHLLGRLAKASIQLPQSSVPTLTAAVHQALASQRSLIARITRDMRKARHHRWKQLLPTLWKERPGVIFHWLHDSGAPWGTTPILDESGMQCLSLEAVDGAVKRYWVDSILRTHALVDGPSQWSIFLASRFGSHIPVVEWPHPPWSAERVHMVLGRMREGAAPGALGIPLAIWKVLPQCWSMAVARILLMVESEGIWPAEWTSAYVAMIPKSSGGSRPQDQRPITVLDLLYRIWAKGVVLSWQSTLQTFFLGPAAMGFRAGAGTLHVAQLLSDIISLQRQRRQELWLASFDIQKCFDTLPWWAVFGVLRHAGVAPQIVACF